MIRSEQITLRSPNSLPSECDYAEAIYTSISACAGGQKRILVLHSSLANLSPPPEVSKWDILRALRRLLADGHTLALPAFTFSFCQDRGYDFRRSRSESGILADLALELVEFRRTHHPIYSFAVAGPRAEALIECRNTTTFSEDSIFAYFAEQNARIVMLGADWTYCTQFHYIEEAAAVPYRYYKTFAGPANYGFGETQASAKMFVRNRELGIENDFSSLIDALAKHGHTQEIALWKSRVSAVDCCALVETGRQLLNADSWALVKNNRQARRKFEWQQTAANRSPIKIALAGSANLALLGEALQQTLVEMIQDQFVEIYTPPFGQLLGELFTPDSRLSGFSPNLSFFPDRIEDLLGVNSLAGLDHKLILERVTQYCDGIAAYRQRCGGWIIVHRFPSPPNHLLSAAPHNIRDVIEEANRILDERLQPLPNVRLLDIAGVAMSGAPLLDHRLWFIGRFPHSRDFSAALALRYAGFVLAATGRTARVIVLDLDNTLWGGVLGEDGIEGVKIGGDYPGNAFLAFQRALIEMSHSGIALAIASKNDETHTLEAMRSLPDMAIKEGDIVAHRISWNPKWLSVSEICEELSLSPANVLFVDDNPAERELMRQMLPDVKILDLPVDPALYADTLLTSPWLQQLDLTAEDLKRVASYKVRANILNLQRSAKDAESFYASLEPTLYCEPLEASNAARTVQLLHKTNQFNTTTRRYDLAALQKLQGTGADIIVLGLSDRFSARENIGLLILDWKPDQAGWAEVDSYLLSCRVLGRGMETAILRWLAKYAKSKGAKGLIGRIIETERNAPARSVFLDAGYSPGENPGEWRLPLEDVRPQTPQWLSVAGQFEKRAR